MSWLTVADWRCAVVLLESEAKDEVEDWALTGWREGAAAEAEDEVVAGG